MVVSPRRVPPALLPGGLQGCAGRNSFPFDGWPRQAARAPALDTALRTLAGVLLGVGVAVPGRLASRFQKQRGRRALEPGRSGP